jgi:hypothetical protein
MMNRALALSDAAIMVGSPVIVATLPARDANRQVLSVGRQPATSNQNLKSAIQNLKSN